MDDLLPSTTGAGAGLFGKTRLKFWAIGAIVILSFWTLFTGTVTLKWSTGGLAHISDDLDAPIHDDLDVLEIEEREKVVRHMWDVYTHSRRIQLPRFWQEAFEAAYEELASDEATVRDGALAEIAKMSMRIANLEPPPRQQHASKGNGEKNHKEEIRRSNTTSIKNQ